MTTPITIRLDYLLQGETDWHTLHFTPTEFFDLDPGEEPAVDSVWRFLVISRFIPVPRASLSRTRLAIADPRSGEVHRFTEQYWNGGRNVVTERTDVGPKGTSWQLILQTTIGGPPDLIEIVRLSRTVAGDVSLASYSLNPDT